MGQKTQQNLENRARTSISLHKRLLRFIQRRT